MPDPRRGYLQPQLSLGRTVPADATWRPVCNGDEKGFMWRKPKGGLWTSTWQPETRRSAWSDWLMANMPPKRLPRGWVLTPDPAARVFVVHTLADLATLDRRYPWNPVPHMAGLTLLRGLDFERMCADGYDGVHLTEHGQWRTRLTEPSLYGWDCESTIWLRWAFTSVEPVEVEFTVPLDGVDEEQTQ